MLVRRIAAGAMLVRPAGLRPYSAVVGCGSNVVDVFFRVREMPRADSKGYFKDGEKVCEGEVVGGVTLNHLSWASVLGADVGLMALQGDDATGRRIRTAMSEMGVSEEFVRVSAEVRSDLPPGLRARRFLFVCLLCQPNASVHSWQSVSRHLVLSGEPLARNRDS